MFLFSKTDPEQVHQTLHVDYPAASPANQDNSQGKKNLDEDPVVQSIWPNSSESKETDKYFSKHSFPVSLVQNLFPQTSNAKQSSSTPQNSQLDSLRTMDHNFNYYIIPLAQFHPASSLKEMSYGYSSASFNSESTGLDQHCFSFPHYNNYQMPFPVGTQKSACPSCQCTSSCLEIMDMNLLHSQVQPKSASKEKQFSLTGINIPNNTLSQMVPIPSATPLILKNSQMSTAPKIQTDGTVCSVSEASGVLVSPLQKQSNYYSQSWVSKHCDQNNCASPSKQSLMSMKDESMTSYIYSENMNSILQSQPPNLMLLADVACSQILHDNKLYRVPVIQSTNMKSAKALNK
ncbi:uncharacterized protein LOC127529009 [Erpetoichthys calabaricus]|uniref:uncharacterized protein LOC127529009 n=1 Tax=Erpetoichthys calabaricus TaxID=27687 RepID=UPI0022340D76|nr:uncharacterized protein LOC127529009 [Erpetoichthys calabaricus]